ncbi:MAG: hypothetical protein ACK556_00880, partial [Pseudanabaena sp.]
TSTQCVSPIYPKPQNAEESTQGAEQYFTHQKLIKAIVNVMQPTPLTMLTSSSVIKSTSIFSSSKIKASKIPRIYPYLIFSPKKLPITYKQPLGNSPQLLVN